MSIATEDGVNIIEGVGLRVGVPIAARYRNARAPKGQFWLIDTFAEDEAELGELEVRHKLIYVE